MIHLIDKLLYYRGIDLRDHDIIWELDDQEEKNTKKLMEARN